MHPRYYDYEYDQRADEREREKRERESVAKRNISRGMTKILGGQCDSSQLICYKHKHKHKANVKCATYTIRVVWALILNLPRLIIDIVDR